MSDVPKCKKGLAHQARTYALFGLWISNVSYFWNHISRYAQTIKPMVSCDVVCNGPENRNKRIGYAADIGFGKLPYGLDLDA